MKPIFLENWSEENTKDLAWKSEKAGPIEHIKSDFEITDDELEGVEILLAFYTYEDYSGDAFVLFRKNGKLFEVNAGHCSCYGLEHQWEPEETIIESLEHRLNEGNLGVDTWWGNEPRNKFANELREVLAELKGRD